MNIPTVPRPAPGIWLGNRWFTEPTPFSMVSPGSTQGIYAILAFDAQSRPRPFRVLYIGESENLKKRVTNQHEKFSDWVQEAGGIVFFVSFHSTVVLTDEQRKDAEEKLIAQYDPPCNTHVNFWAAILS
jgi:excinuclease UvrABC nuclease subunit